MTPEPPPRDERSLRIATAIAMWFGGAVAISCGIALNTGAPLDTGGLRGIVVFCLIAGIGTGVCFPQLSMRGLYVATNLFTALGTAAIALTIYWSGEGASGFFELLFFPVLYAAYFFGARVTAWQVLLASAFAASALLTTGRPEADQLPGHVAVLVASLWATAFVIGHYKRCLLTAEREARRQALTDPLTGLHNLRSLNALAKSTVFDEGSAVVLIDLDHFKEINTHYQHTGADRLLAELGHQLQETVPAGACAARVGGDEFAVLVQEKTLDAHAIARRCALVAPRVRGATGLRGPELSASVGVAVWPKDGRTFDELLRAADDAMFAAKRPTRDSDRRSRGSETASSEERGARDHAVATAPPRLRPAPTQPSHEAIVPHELRLRQAMIRLRNGGSARVAACSWLAGVALTLLVVFLPGADRQHSASVIALDACAAVFAAMLLRVGPRWVSAMYLVSNTFAMVVLAVAVYVTGGAISPLLPLVFIGVAFAAYFFSTRGVLVQLVGAAAVCASPLWYTAGHSRQDFVVRLIALVTTSGVIAIVLAYCKRELAQAERAARALARHDALTGLANRRALYECVERALASRASGGEQTLSLAMVDIDNFKRVNDRHGHSAGDELLRGIARALAGAVRADDLVARVGGDEFATLAIGADMAMSRALGMRCVEAVEQAASDAGFGACGVSATVGYALLPYHADTFHDLIEEADQALMRAKQAGKRQVAAAERPWPPSVLASA